MTRVTAYMTASTVVAGLLADMDALVPSELYPADVLSIPNQKITGTAFFPGGSGLYLEDVGADDDVQFPFGGAMILGHNFDSEIGFHKSFSDGKESLTSSTWGPLLRLLTGASIPPEQCFFSNAFMGMCAGADNRDYKGRDDKGFRDGCLEFLLCQIETQRPRFILTLGLHAPPLLACASSDLKAWKGRPKRNGCDPKLRLHDLDVAPIFYDAKFELWDGAFHTAVVTAIAHPSLPNGRRRKPNNFTDEAALIFDGWNRSASR
jgi:hypothetical protein